MENAEILSYWRAGLEFLLAEKELDAQMTWALGWSLVEDDSLQSAEALQAFTTLLTQAAAEQSSQQNHTLAWAMRQYVYQADPYHWENLLESWHLAHHLAMEAEKQDALRCLQESLDQNSAPKAILKLLNAFPSQPFSPLLIPLMGWVVDQHLLSVPQLREWLLEKIPLFGNHLRAADRLAFFQFCYALDPHHQVFVLELATSFQETQQVNESLVMLEKFLALDPSPLNKMVANFMKTRGLLQSSGRWSEAEESYNAYKYWLNHLIDQQIELDHMNARSISSTGFVSLYFQDDPQENHRFLKVVNSYSCQQFQKHYLPLVEVIKSNYPPISGNRKIRIAYMSECFRRHSVGWIARWLYKYHDRQKFEIYTYSFVKQPDDLQQFFIDHSDRYFTLYQAMPTDDAVIKIHEDQIDILIDLDVLTSDYAAGILSLKPAPIQVAWLGSDCAQHPMVDYYIADGDVLPEDAQSYYGPTIWRMPKTYVAVEGFEVGIARFTRSDLDIPADAMVYWSAQSNNKRHPHTVKLQMQIVQAVPDSYFLIKGGGRLLPFEEFFRDAAREVGLDPDRLRFISPAPSEEVHRAEMLLADVVLDTYPYNGATTTLETLWMGIPLVTKVGQQFAARNSYMMLKQTGVTAGIAHSDAEYLNWGIRLGMEPALREAVHHQLIRSRRFSPLWDARNFTRDLEDAYTQMWQIYGNAQK